VELNIESKSFHEQGT